MPDQPDETETRISYLVEALRKVTAGNREERAFTPSRRADIQFFWILAGIVFVICSGVVGVTLAWARLDTRLGDIAKGVSEADKHAAVADGHAAIADAKAVTAQKSADAAFTIGSEVKAEVERRTESLTKLLAYKAVLEQYDFALWKKEHDHIWSLNRFGISFLQDYVREHGNPPPYADTTVQPTPHPRK